MDNDHVSPLIQRINYLVIFLSLFGMLSSHVESMLIFRPSFIYMPEGVQDAPIKLVEYPYVWTFLTSVFVETNPVFMLMHLFLINYIVIKNKSSFEEAWRRQDLFFLLCISGLLSSLTHFGCRLALMKLSQKTYVDFTYCSLNLIIMALLLGLK